MRNLKKVLSLALALVMLLGMMVVGAGAATSFSDADKIKNTEAVDVVSGIGVLTGVGDGSFNPEGTLSRAEAAVVVAKLDLGAAFGNLETTNASTFSDVPAGYWGKAYIDYCFARGLIAGVGNNKYNPNGKVTGVEFALMVSRVLGYEDKAEQVGGADWEVDAAALARKAGLTVDVKLGSLPMTRDEMAQVAYNALKANMVEYPNGSINIDVNGTPVTIGGNPAQAKKNDGVAQYDSGSTVVYNGATLQLCEEKFPLLKLSSDEDAFQRDTKLWTYGRDTIHESPTTADKTYTKGVQVKTIAKDLKVESGATCEIWVDGVKNFEGKIASATIKDSYITTGNGVLTEAWLYAGNEKVYDHVKITVIHTFVGKVTGVNTAKETVTVATQGTNIKTYTSTVNNKLVKTFKTTGYEIGDLVTFTAAYEAATTGKYDIQEMDHLELTATGTLNKWKGLTLPGADKGSDEASFTVADQDYEYSANYGVVNENGDDYTVYEFNAGKSEVNVYLDKYNYAIFVSGVEAEKNYAAVIGVGATNAYGSETKGVTLLFPDNTTKEVVATSKDWGKMTSVDPDTYTTLGKIGDNNKSNLVTDGIADIVTYTVGDNDVYTLYLADSGKTLKTDGQRDVTVYTSNYDPTPATTLPEFVNGRSKIEITSKYNGANTNGQLSGVTAGSAQTYYTTSKTIFMVATQKDSTDKYAGREYAVYTGYADAPGFTTTAGRINGIAFVLNKQYPTQVDVVYIDAVETAGVTSVDAYFVINREYHQIATSSDGGIYELPAIVDGKEETILIKANTVADWDRNGSASGDGKLGEIGNGLYAIKDVKKDKNGVIYSCTVQSGSGFYKAANGLAGTVKPNRIVMGIGPTTSPLNTEAQLRGHAGTTYWAYNDKTSVYYVDKDYKTISVIEMETGVQTDLDDAVYATHDNATGTEKKLVDVIIVEDACKAATYTVNPSAHVEIRSANSSWTGTATTGAQTFSSGATVYVKAVKGWAIDTSATTAVTLNSIGSGVYSFTAGNVAADAIKTKEITTASDANIEVRDVTEGYSITRAHIITAAEIGTGKEFAGGTAGALYIEFTAPSGITVNTSGAPTVTLSIGSVTRTITMGNNTLVAGKTYSSTSSAAVDGWDGTAYLDFTAAAPTHYAVQYNLDAVPGFSLVATTTEKLAVGGGAVTFTLKDANGIFVDGTVKYTVKNGAGAESGVITKTSSSKAVTTDSITPTGTVVIKITSITPTKVMGEMRDTTGVAGLWTSLGTDVVNASAGLSVADDGLDLQTTGQSITRGTGIKSAKVKVSITGATKNDGTAITNPIDAEITSSGKLQIATNGKFKPTGSAKVVVTITEVTEITLDRSSAFTIDSTNSTAIDGQKPDTIAVDKDVVLVKDGNVWKNKEGFKITLSKSATVTAGGETGQIVISGTDVTTKKDSDSATAGSANLSLDFSFAAKAITFNTFGSAFSVTATEKA